VPITGCDSNPQAPGEYDAELTATIAIDAVGGTHAVRAIYGSTSTSLLTPCPALTWGTIEDMTFAVVAPTPTATPTAAPTSTPAPPPTPSPTSTPPPAPTGTPAPVETATPAPSATPDGNLPREGTTIETSGCGSASAADYLILIFLWAGAFGLPRLRRI
jgi:hypothetical protein